MRKCHCDICLYCDRWYGSEPFRVGQGGPKEAQERPETLPVWDRTAGKGSGGSKAAPPDEPCVFLGDEVKAVNGAGCVPCQRKHVCEKGRGGVRIGVECRTCLLRVPLSLFDPELHS